MQSSTPPNFKIQEKPQEKSLPTLRKDIQMLQIADASDGTPMYNLYDPVRAQYFQISWAEALIFKLLQPGMTTSDLLKAIQAHSTLNVNEEGLLFFFQDAARNNLLEIPSTSDELMKKLHLKKRSPLMWLLTHYLYIRIPLIDPDAFLGSTLKYVKPLFSKFALILYSLIALSGLLLLINRFDEFLHTFTYFFNPQGILVYGLTIILIKVVHEFAHAYVAKYFGVRVPQMGVAFLVLWPVLYTDVTDGWKLSKKHQRFLISSAGILAELALAGLATWGWVLSAPGLLQSVFFIVASVTWIFSLLVNLNPAMRFDGYYLLGDLWGVDNLQQRAFAITRWQLRKSLFGLNVPPPEHVSTQRKAGMIAYTLFTWTYRLSVYIAVALFVYFYFTKALGIFLFIFEIIVFILWPIVSEIQELLQLKNFFTMNIRAKITLSILAGLLLFFIIPLPTTNKFATVVAPNQNQILYIPYDSVIEAVLAQREDTVVAGQPLLVLSSMALEADLKTQKIAEEILQRQLLVAGLSEESRTEIQGKQAELRTVQAKLHGLEAYKSHLIIKAEFPGFIYEWDQNLRVGEHLPKDAIIGKIASLGHMNAQAYIPENQINEVSVGKKVGVRLNNPIVRLPGKILTLNPIRDQTLAESQLGSVFRGPLPVVQDPKTNKLKFVESYYVGVIELEKTDQRLYIGQTGVTESSGPWRSYLSELLHFLQRVFWRESGI